jgi:hypothetical protein
MDGAQSLHARPSLRHFQSEAIESGLRVLTPTGHPVADLTRDDRGWTMYCEDGHVHRRGLEDALNTLEDLTEGRARWAVEYRGDTKAAAWLERRDGEYYEVSDLASYLAPFDPDEWTLWPGEEWVVRRAEWTCDDSGELLKHYSELRLGEPTGVDEKRFEWISSALGPATEGTRWTTGYDYRVVLQAPSGWRRLPAEDGQYDSIFAPAGKRLLLRINTYFRDSEAPKADVAPLAKRVSEVEVKRDEEQDREDGWHSDRWQLTFSGDQQDMMAILELFWREADAEEARQYRPLLERTAHETRYIEGEWNMQLEAERTAEGAGS